jgi:serine/threonine-protein kinase 24/25/MST4
LTFILGTPPAYSGRRAPYATRTSVDGARTVWTPADLGTGMDTIRPVTNVDPVGPLLSSLRSAPRCASSETARAGGLMVDEVLLPILNNVCSPNLSIGDFSPTSGSTRLLGMIWTLERLNL